MLLTAEQYGHSARTEFEQKQVYDLASEWEVTEPLSRFTESGLDVDALCAEARRLLR